MTVKSDEQITSGKGLPWAKRVEAQRAQAAVMNAITESKDLINKSVQTNADK